MAPSATRRLQSAFASKSRSAYGYRSAMTQSRFTTRAFAIGLVFICTNSIADAGSSIIGAGSQTCTAWNNRKASAIVKGSFESWLIGFISGLNIAGEKDIIGAGDFDAIISWMDQRCLRTPSDRVGIAGLDLGMELVKKAATR